MDFTTLHRYADEYLASLCDTKEEEYGTNRQLAETIVTDLFQYMEMQEAILAAKVMLENNGYEVHIR